MKLTLNQIGSFAQQVLMRSSSATVSGITSRGIFLQPREDWTLYLSQEKFRGPLTLNLAEGSINLDTIKPGNTAQLTPEAIHFQNQNLTLSLDKAEVWHPPIIETQYKLDQDSLAALLLKAKEISPDNPYLPLLFSQANKIPGVPVISERIIQVQKALKSGNQELFEEGLILLLGLGPGLTPLGDDFLLGVLLTLNRWGESLDYSPENITLINQTILENTWIKTTRISSSLLTCAVEGAADERLLDVLDAMGSGKEISRNSLKNILRWGNTSGITVLAGMISVLS